MLTVASIYRGAGETPCRQKNVPKDNFDINVDDNRSVCEIRQAVPQKKDGILHVESLPHTKTTVNSLVKKLEVYHF